MSRAAIILSVIAMCLASPAHAELRTLPGGTTQIAVTRIGCSVEIDGQELMNGTCHHRLTDSADVFMTLPESATQIVVNVSRRGGEVHVVRLWAQTPDGKQRREYLGGVRPQGECQRQTEYHIICGPCWANERVRICAWALGEHPEQTEPPASLEQHKVQTEEPMPVNAARTARSLLTRPL